MGKKEKSNKIEKILMIIAAICLVAGVICFVIKALTIPYVDSVTGILHERFFLLHMGYGFLSLAAILSVVSIIENRKNKKNS